MNKKLKSNDSKGFYYIIMSERDFFELKQGEYSEEEPPEYYPFSYELDNFQKYGFDAISKNENILVTAHTGAGKTALAIYGIAKWLNSDDSQIIYCSPIKALSNQKYKEFKEKFEDRGTIGILTGDVKINPTARVLIMTAEILRNALVSSANEIDDIYDFKFNTDKVKCIILDEVHYINNSERGKVWEEILSIVNPKIQIIMLSATLSKSEELAKWVGKEKQVMCKLIPTDFRPVPLNHYLYDFSRERDKEFPSDPLVCVSKGKDINVAEETSGWVSGKWSEVFKSIKKFQKKNNLRYINYPGVLFDSIKYCKNNSMLPVNIFILDRNKLEKLANDIPTTFIMDDLQLAKIDKIWNNHLLPYKNVFENTKQWNIIYKLAIKGIGIHHSGIIPILKEIVEILYEEGLIKVLFATETFAMGVNMPTKTVIFYSVSKFDGNEKRSLRPEEYIQMAGRAGRRGYDSFGSVIIIPDNNLENENDSKKMIISDPQSLSSKLTIDYTFVLKRLLLHTQSKEQDELFLDYVISSLSSSLKSRSQEKTYAYNSKFLNFNLKDSKAILSKNYEKLIDMLNPELKTKLTDNFQNESYNISEVVSSYEIFKEIESLKETISTDNSNFVYQIKPDKKLVKQISKYEKTLINQIKLDMNKDISEDMVIDLYKVMYNNIKNIKELKKDKDNLKSVSDNFSGQVKSILSFLENEGIVDSESKTGDFILTSYGRLIAEINECNPFLLGFFINNDMISEFNFEEIVGIVSILIAEYSNQEHDFRYLSDLKNNSESNNLGDVITFIENLFEYKDNLETKESILFRNLMFPFNSDWSLNLNLFEIVRKWASGVVEWREISSEFNSFEGNFCRSILRIVNVLRNIESICKIVGNSNLLNKINGYQEKLVRGIVTTDSLYI